MHDPISHRLPMLLLLLPGLASAFVAPARIQGMHAGAHCESRGALRMQEGGGLLDTVQTSFEIFQASQAEGQSFKQAMADALAGEFDRDALTAQVQTEAKSAPLVLFTWESSPSCKKALKYLEMTGATPTVIRLDDPWPEGNKKRGTSR